MQNDTGVQIRCQHGAVTPFLIFISQWKRLTAILMSHYHKDSRTDGAPQRQRETEGRKRWTAEKEKKRKRENGEKKKKKRKRDGERGGGTVLTPACLFYLGAQHGYRCCAAPSHRDMTASLCSHTIPPTHTQIHTHTHTRSAPHAAASPRYSSSSPSISLPFSLSLSLSLQLTVLHLDTSGFTHTHLHTNTHTHTHEALKHTLPSFLFVSLPLSVPLARRAVVLTYLEPCPLSLSLSLSLLAVSLPSAAAHSQYQFLTVYKYVWRCVLCLATHFFTSAPPSAHGLRKALQLFAHGDLIMASSVPEVQPQINTFDLTDTILTTRMFDADWEFKPSYCLYL